MQGLIFTDFEFNGKTLSSFGGAIYNNGNGKANLLPSLTINSDTITGYDGAIPYGAKFDPRVIDLSVIIQNKNFNRSEFNKWLGTKESGWFKFVGDNKKIKVFKQDSLDIDVYNEKQGTLDISFIAYDPFWVLETSSIFERSNPVINTSYTFNNTGNVNSHPYTKITLPANVKIVTFVVNSLTFKIELTTGFTSATEIIIDSETETVYRTLQGEKINMLPYFSCTTSGKFKFTFPKTVPGTNSFKLISGSLSNFYINCNSKIL